MPGSQDHEQGSGDDTEYIRRAMRAEKGDVLVFEAEDGEVRVRVAREPVSFAEYAGKWREGEGKSVEEINAWLRELRGHEEGRAAGS